MIDGDKGAKFEILILSTNTVVFYRSMGRQDDLWGCETVWLNLELLYCHLWLHMAMCDERNTGIFSIWIQNKLKENKKKKFSWHDDKMIRQWWVWDHEECDKMTVNVVLPDSMIRWVRNVEGEKTPKVVPDDRPPTNDTAQLHFSVGLHLCNFLYKSRHTSPLIRTTE